MCVCVGDGVGEDVCVCEGGVTQGGVTRGSVCVRGRGVVSHGSKVPSCQIISTPYHLGWVDWAESDQGTEQEEGRERGTNDKTEKQTTKQQSNNKSNKIQ